MSILHVVTRPLMAAVFVNGAYNQLVNAKALAGPTQRLIDSLPVRPDVDPVRLVHANGAVMAVAGTGLALGIAPRTCAAVLAATLVPTTLAGHRYWDVDDPMKRLQHRNSFWGNVTMAGGLLTYATTPRRRKVQPVATTISNLEVDS